MSVLAGRIDEQLRSIGTPERAEYEKRYLKSELEHYGATVWAVRMAVKDALATEPELDRKQLFGRGRGALVAAGARVSRGRSRAARPALTLRGGRLRAGRILTFRCD